MHCLPANIKELYQALNERKRIFLNSKGFWKVENQLQAFLRLSFQSEEQAFFSLVKSFNSWLDTLENYSIRFPVDEGEHAVEQEVDFSSILDTIQLLVERLKSYHIDKAQLLLNQLASRNIALLYRLEKINRGIDKTSIDIDKRNLLIEEAVKWKKNQKIFWKKTLSESDYNKINEACCYPLFIEILLKDPILKNDFFNWTLRDGISIAPFIEFPGIREKLIENNLHGRIGRMGGDFLKIAKETTPKQENIIEKVLLLPFDGRLINILNEKNEIKFQGEYNLTIKEIYRIFKRKLLQAGNLEYFSQGITNWNAHRLGWWNEKTGNYELVDLDQSDWWFQMPIFEILTLEEAQNRYGENVDGKQWILIAKATREYPTLNYAKSHAYLEIAIPIAGRCYSVYDFGKVATEFPATHWEEMRTFTVTVLAAIAYPDENVYYLHRQQVGYCFYLQHHEGLKFMDSIKSDILKSREGNVVFQIESENCGRWIQNLLEEQLGKDQVPNLFRMHLIDAEPIGLPDKIFRFVRILPRFCRSRILAFLHLPFGAWKGRWVVDKQGKKEWKSLNTSSYWQDGIVYLPARLHREREMSSKAHPESLPLDIFEKTP